MWRRTMKRVNTDSPPVREVAAVHDVALDGVVGGELRRRPHLNDSRSNIIYISYYIILYHISYIILYRRGERESESESEREGGREGGMERGICLIV